MDLPSTLGVPRMCWLAGRIFWVRPISMEALGILLAWLDDVLSSRDDPELLPRLSDDASQEQLRSPTGRSLVRWLALRDQGVTFSEAAALEAASDDDRLTERVRLERVLFSRRKTYESSPGATDISELWCGPEFIELVQMIGLDQLKTLTLDQFEWLVSGGNCDTGKSPEALGIAQAMKIYNEAVARDPGEAAGSTVVLPDAPHPDYIIKED